MILYSLSLVDTKAENILVRKTYVWAFVRNTTRTVNVATTDDTNPLVSPVK